MSSYITMLVLLFILALAAAYGTFIENDFGNLYAREHIYTSVWYQTLLFIGSTNMVLVFLKHRIKLLRPAPIFHFSFILILIGAFVTHHFGIDGTMRIREGEKSNTIEIGNTKLTTPFHIKLNDFELIRYPGSRAPSEFKSNVTVLDYTKNRQFDTDIYMNNTLIVDGYKFFQSSYDDDEKGTVLSVNKDPGVHITYIGYGILFLALILTLFDKKSRFRFLIREIKRMPIASILFILSFSFYSTTTFSQETKYSDYLESYLSEHKNNSKELAKSFGRLIVQGPTGRMKPLDTQNREILNKLTGKNTWNGMTANQVVLGMVSRPELWKKVNIIRVKTPKLRKLLDVAPNQKLVSFSVFFDENNIFKLTKQTSEANKLPPSRRGTFERDIIQVDELLNIAFMSQRGMLLKVFPIPKDSANTWADMPTMFLEMNDSNLKRNTATLLDVIYSRDYSKAQIYIDSIQNYQNTQGKNVMPSLNKIETELWYNKSALFFKLSIGYILLGLFLLVYSISSMFYNKMIHKKVKTFFTSIVLVLFITHTIGIALRWYIGGYAPISNTYETMIYIAYSSIFAGLVFFRRSFIALGSSLIMAGIFIFAAYLGEINPQITSLVPVLKSYWLSIHVSVITASYGFFGMSATLGIVTLFIFIIKNEQRTHLDKQIKNLTFLNEAVLILAIVLLTIGNFLGGIWANESWGRYWGWDPKETWTYISILIYTIVLHLRLIKKIYSHYLFNVSAVLAFYTILMTYYGVNFYLSGMHSYATGDPIPIPLWVYLTFAAITILIILAYRKRKLILK